MEFKFFDSADFTKGIRVSSISDMVASQRKSVYDAAIDNLETLRKINAKLQNFDASNFVENTAPSTMGIALAEASIKAQINSIVGYVAIERAMTQMNQMLVYRDVLTKAGAMVMPNVGPDDPRSRASKVYQAAITAAETDIAITLDPLVAGTLAIVLKLGSNTYNLMDDRQGNVLCQAGVIDAGTINYATGALAITLAAGAPADSSIKICYAVNKQLGQGNNRTTIKQGYFNINARINKFEFEADLITAMISQKTVGGDIVAELQQSVYDEQVLSINNALVDTLRAEYAGNTLTIDLDAFSLAGGFFDSLLKTFNAGLAAVDNELAKRCYKAIAATAYIVGNGAATLFMSLEDAQGWVPNNTGYVNDIIGFYKGRAVVRNLHCSDFECFAIHKTADSKLAPLGYGILLPATNLPLVGNFANTSEVASGIYSVDGTAKVAIDLAQRFVLSMPADWMVAA
jgi:hypothetical protein